MLLAVETADVFVVIRGVAAAAAANAAIPDIVVGVGTVVVLEAVTICAFCPRLETVACVFGIV
ncbi:hypothetical protein DERP_000184 [Dermatophagoides pteronyssinus]|uniref:Secreted peptide n=1 Tax=Dermatophagoides pteronyssinus TaxID=6956 RepID=A0ABQ8IZE3_DERPT|nr:hypothetical protein DERP_000184 [Dermatophagoides pteronyssinus]